MVLQFRISLACHCSHRVSSNFIFVTFSLAISIRHLQISWRQELDTIICSRIQAESKPSQALFPCGQSYLLWTPWMARMGLCSYSDFSLSTASGEVDGEPAWWECPASYACLTWRTCMTPALPFSFSLYIAVRCARDKDRGSWEYV